MGTWIYKIKVEPIRGTKCPEILHYESPNAMHALHDFEKACVANGWATGSGVLKTFPSVVSVERLFAKDN